MAAPPAAGGEDEAGLFEAPGWSTPSRAAQPRRGRVSSSEVRAILSMAQSALAAKQRKAEALRRELERVKSSTPAGEELLQRAQRAEVDSGSLLEELQALMEAKTDLAQQRADLDRANALLVAERELLCEQLHVPPDSVNLCQAVQQVLAAARRAKGLEQQLRLLARCQREVLRQLEASREDAARSARHWRACEAVYLGCLAAHGIVPPDLPSPAEVEAAAAALPYGAPGPCSPSSSSSSPGSSRAAEAAAAAVAAGSCSSSSGRAVSSSAEAVAPVGQQLGLRACSSSPFASLAGPAGSLDAACVGSPAASQVHMLPPTPPASDLHLAAAAPASRGRPRRSHSLDSGLNSLTGLLDQLALGQLGSDDVDLDLDDSPHADEDSWMLVDADEHEAPPPRDPKPLSLQQQLQQQYRNLQPVAEGQEVQVFGLGTA